MRRLLRELATTGEVKGDTTTLEDFTVVAKLKEGDEQGRSFLSGCVWARGSSYVAPSALGFGGTAYLGLRLRLGCVAPLALLFGGAGTFGWWGHFDT
jgi:hypothetical protein